jgi:hypothetical protein
MSNWTIALWSGVMLLVGTPAPSGPRLEVVSHDRVLWSTPVQPGDTFEIAFQHSQERTAWVQHYRVGIDRAIWQDGSTFGSYGAGMPLMAVNRDHGGFHTRQRRRIGELRMLSSTAAGLRMDMNGRTLEVGRWFDDYEPFAIRVR